jgi:hypothetical protein
MKLSDWLFERTGRTHSIPLTQLFELLFEHFTVVLGDSPAVVGRLLGGDYQRSGRHDLPRVLRPFAPPPPPRVSVSLPSRQARHLAEVAKTEEAAREVPGRS